MLGIGVVLSQSVKPEKKGFCLLVKEPRVLVSRKLQIQTMKKITKLVRKPDSAVKSMCSYRGTRYGS